MATATQDDLILDGAWTDLVAENAACASVDLVIQNLGLDKVQVVFGGAAAPAATITGIVLREDGSCEGNAANIWLRAYGQATVSVTLK